MEMITEIAESQKATEENKEATSTADLLEKLSVEEKKTEDKTGEETCAAKEKESKTEDAEKEVEDSASST